MGERGYLDLLKEIATEGKLRSNRTGIDTYSLFGKHLEFDISESFPLITTKKTFFKGIAQELLWFLEGSTDAKKLNERGCKIWNGNSTKEFLENRELNYREGDIGPMYGFQWRHCGSEYRGCDADYTGEGIDQIQKVIDLIKTDPDSRRMVISSYIPHQLNEMALEPCHCLVQFYVDDGFLSGHMYQRSADFFLGVPFNIASYSLLIYMMAHVTGTKPGKFHISFGDAHVYSNHLKQLETQLERDIKPPPKLKIKGDHTSIFDIKYEDLELIDYEHHPYIKADMAV